MQIIADALNRPVKFSDTREASSRGAVLLALETLGALTNLSSTIERDSVKTFMPDATRHARYRAALDRQQAAYHKIISHQN